MKNGKRTKRQLIEGVHRALERRGKFGADTIAYGEWNMPDKNYRYRQPWYERIITGFWRSVLIVFGPLFIKMFFGARVVGKENLKPLKRKGVITVCNHIHYLDTLFVRQAIGHINSYHTMAPWNNKYGIGGHIIRHGGMWPFSSDFAAMRNMSAEMERQLKRGKRINFNPEHALWWNYQKPRPMKDGAFHYAVKFNVPVVPVFCTFKKSKRGGMRKLRINILPAVFPDSDLPKKEGERKMKEEAESRWRECYESAYGIPLEYLSKNL